MTELTIREIQLVSLEILHTVATICEEQNFRYSLIYGTLIGAIRHHGYIPWDDDVDIMMPRMDGVTMTIKLREHHEFPVIMLSAKSEETDKVIGLNIGADDYVTKPFTPLELMARVNSQLRCYTRFMGMAQKKEEEGRNYVIGGLELNEDTIEFSVDGNPVKLTPIEFKILALLMKNPGRVYSADEIYERVWNEKAINTDTIMVHVRNIREKIELDPKNPKYLKVVWGVGYKIEKQP